MDPGRRVSRRSTVGAGAVRVIRVAAVPVLTVALLLRLGLPGATLLSPATAVASCASQVPIKDGLARAQVVFVGTVIYLENGDRWAVVSVEERWRGADGLGPTVEVHGGPDAGTQTGVDRTYEPRRYLFAVDAGTGYLVDDACTATTPWTDDLARLRPAGVAAAPGLAVSTPFADVNLDIVLPVGAMLIALLIAVASYLVILRSRRRPPDWIR